MSHVRKCPECGTPIPEHAPVYVGTVAFCSDVCLAAYRRRRQG